MKNQKDNSTAVFMLTENDILQMLEEKGIDTSKLSEAELDEIYEDTEQWLLDEYNECITNMIAHTRS